MLSRHRVEDTESKLRSLVDSIPQPDGERKFFVPYRKQADEHSCENIRMTTRRLTLREIDEKLEKCNDILSHFEGWDLEMLMHFDCHDSSIYKDYLEICHYNGLETDNKIPLSVSSRLVFRRPDKN